MYPRQRDPTKHRMGAHSGCRSMVMWSLRLVGLAVQCILGVISIRCCVPQVRRKCHLEASLIQ